MPISLVGASGMPSGSVLQVQHTQHTGQSSFACTAVTDRILGVLTVNITPTATNSVIKLDAQIFGEFDTTLSTAWNHMFFFYRDTTKLGQAAAGDRLVGVSMITQTYSQSGQNAGSTPECGIISFFDSPSSTSQITYKVGIRTRSNTTLYLNRTVDDTDANTSERGISFISATEIAG
tara:strand:- start:300 stop:830 length:531 start_codon:yes stop_codon:yes gene_type:complete